jgi:hypothetical protein
MRKQYVIIITILLKKNPLKNEKTIELYRMIKNRKELRKFEDELVQTEKVNITKNFHIVDAMYKEAVSLGVFPLKDTLSGIEIDIKIAKVINSVSKTT